MARILFADDDREQLHIFQLLLQSSGHELLLATNVAEVAAHLEEGPVDLLVVDLRFPCSADGLALIRRVRESGCRTPIIVLSGWPDEICDVPEERMISRVMMKPVRVPELLDAIADLTSAAASARAQNLPSASP